MSWSDTYWRWWLVAAVGIGFGIPEAIALLDGNPSTDPLTGWTVERGLAELAAVVGAFLLIHFGVRAVRRR